MYDRNKTLLDVVKQDLRMLIKTIPGEKIRDEEYGVGLERFLFEPMPTTSPLRSRIFQQVDKYLPYVSITNVDIMANSDENMLRVYIEYNIPSISISDFLSLEEKL